MKLIRVVGALSLFVLVPWFFYANQTEQRLKCVAYEFTGMQPPLAERVTCMLNGNG